jgi:hypothetical protein
MVSPSGMQNFLDLTFGRLRVCRLTLRQLPQINVG